MTTTNPGAALSIPLMPFAGDATLPGRVDVVVIGGGIIGVCTALDLAERGISVAVCEKGLIGAEQSSRNWGWIRQMGRAEAELPLAQRSARLWSGMEARTGRDLGYRQCGILYAAYTASDEAHWRAWHDIGNRHGIETALLSSAELGARMPYLRGAPRLGLWSPSDACAEPWLAVPSIAEAAREKGARILTHCAVRTVERGGGRITGVITERGSIACDKVVIAAGAWTRLFAGNLGLDFPTLKIIGTVARIEGVAGLPDYPLGTEDFSIRRRQDGQYNLTLRRANIAPVVPDSVRLLPRFAGTLRRDWREFSLRFGRAFFDELRQPRHWDGDTATVFERVRILDPAPDRGFLRRSLANAARAVHGFETARITAAWAGVMDMTPTTVPVIDEVLDVPGLVIASGFSGHGFGIGPGAGELAADLVTGTASLERRAPFILRQGTTRR